MISLQCRPVDSSRGKSKSIGSEVFEYRSSAPLRLSSWSGGAPENRRQGWASTGVKSFTVIDNNPMVLSAVVLLLGLVLNLSAVGNGLQMACHGVREKRKES